jgi:hypothetical protein
LHLYLFHFCCHFRFLLSTLFFFFFRRYNFNRWMLWPSQHIIYNYCDPGCS